MLVWGAMMTIDEKLDVIIRQNEMLLEQLVRVDYAIMRSALDARQLAFYRLCAGEQVLDGGTHTAHPQHCPE